MRKGKFLIVNESIEECVDRKLQVSTENCDVFPALVYIPKFTKKMEKGMFCVLTIMAQILIYGVMGYFFKVGYLGLIVIEVAFLSVYGKEHVWLLRVQMIYLVFQLVFSTLITFIAFLPDASGTRQDFSLIIPSLDRGTMALFGLTFGLFTCLRVILVASYHTHLFYFNLRDKFKDGKVILQPA